jgi:hypothetical protein
MKRDSTVNEHRAWTQEPASVSTKRVVRTRLPARFDPTKLTVALAYQQGFQAKKTKRRAYGNRAAVLDQQDEHPCACSGHRQRCHERGQTNRSN